MPQNLEPFLSDLRLAKIENAIRIRCSGLPLDARYVACYQEPEKVYREDREFIVPAQAAFHIILNNPRHPEFDKWFSGRAPWTSWLRDDEAYRHSTEVLQDPAYHAFMRLAPTAVTWYTNTVELAN